VYPEGRWSRCVARLSVDEFRVELIARSSGSVEQGMNNLHSDAVRIFVQYVFAGMAMNLISWALARRLHPNYIMRNRCWLFAAILLFSAFAFFVVVPVKAVSHSLKDLSDFHEYHYQVNVGHRFGLCALGAFFIGACLSAAYESVKHRRRNTTEQSSGGDSSIRVGAGLEPPQK
jgi:hypothetical protein